MLFYNTSAINSTPVSYETRLIYDKYTILRQLPKNGIFCTGSKFLIYEPIFKFKFICISRIVGDTSNEAFHLVVSLVFVFWRVPQIAFARATPDVQ